LTSDIKKMRSLAFLLFAIAFVSARNLNADIEKLDEALKGVQKDLTQIINEEDKAEKRAAAKIFIVDGSLKATVDDEAGPFKTIGECVEALGNPGDKCQIKAGNYHEHIDISGLEGTEENPIVIEAFGNDRPVIDGTELLQFKSTWEEWSENEDVYVAELADNTPDFWQLFYDADGDEGTDDGRQMLTNARWPNANWDESKVDMPIFDGSNWAYIDKTLAKEVPSTLDGSEEGIIKLATKKRNARDTRNILPEFPDDIDGAMAILNIGSFNTFVSKVKSSTKKSFKYVHTFGKIHFKWVKSRFFLEDKLSLLDDQREWFFDKVNKKLYVWLPSDEAPSANTLRGKTQSYAFEIKNSHHLTFRNLDFFGTTLKATSDTWDNYVSGINLEHCNFNFPSYSKRMLQAAETNKFSNFAVPEWTTLDGITNTGKTDKWGKFRVYDCTFYGSDGLALEYRGKNVEIENNLFSYNDWTAANMDKQMGGKATVSVPLALNDHYLRNTFKYNGASVGIRPGLDSKVELNYITKQCHKVIMNDGAGVQLQKKQQMSANLTHNWVLDQPKYGLRFDGEPNSEKSCDPGKGFKDGLMEYNVVGRCNGMMVKGLKHEADHNLVFQKQNEKDDDKQGKCALCVLHRVRTNPCPINQDSATTHNIADSANGGTDLWRIPNIDYDEKSSKADGYFECKTTYDNNAQVKWCKSDKNHFWNRPQMAQPGLLLSQRPGYVQTLLMDPDHNDFRPRPDMVDELNGDGPYDFERVKEKYWIPGRQVAQASMPVPPNGAGNDVDQRGNPKPKVNAAHRDALMWLNALGADKHAVYLCQGNNCNINDGKLGEVEGDKNVISLPAGKVVEGKEYTWRVDAYHTDGAVTRVEKGDEWKFYT